MSDEALRILEQCSMASVGVEYQLGIFQMLEHEVRVAVGEHRIVAAAHDEDRLVNATQDLVVWVLGRAPASYSLDRKSVV